MQIHSVVFALNRQANKQKYAKIINLLCTGNKMFVTYQIQGGLTPTPSCIRPSTPPDFEIWYFDFRGQCAGVFVLVSHSVSNVPAEISLPQWTNARGG